MFSFPEPGLDAYYRTISLGAFDVSHDESTVAISMNISGTFNLWGMDLNTRFPYQLTYNDQRVRFVKYDPKGRYLLVGLDTDGDEKVQIYAVSTSGGTVVPVRQSPGHYLLFGALNRSGDQLYYTSDKENASFMNLYRYDMFEMTEEVIHTGDRAPIEFGSLAPDESSFTYTEALANTYMLSYVSRENTPRRCLTPDESVTQVTDGGTYLDEDTIVFTTNYEKPFAYAALYRISTGEMSELFAPEAIDIAAVRVDRTRRLVYCVGQRGVEDILYRGSADEPTSFREFSYPGALLFELTVHDSGSVYGLFTQENQPVNLFRLDTHGTWSKLTDNRVLGVSEERMVRAETLHFPSFDGLQLEALHYRAKDDTRNGHTIIMPHGGPQAADRKYFWSFTQYLISKGYDVFAPNFRGSTGYGSEFTKMIDGDWGGAPVKDMMASVDWLIAQGKADKDRLFVLGGSYGGYMTLMLHGLYANSFRAAVDIFGVANLFTFVNSVPDFWKPAMDIMVGDPERDHDRFIAHSPITYIEGMTKPMLIVQGANDPRVVKAESDQIVEKLTQLGRSVEYLVLDDEGHGFSKRENELRVYEAVGNFLDRHRSA
ncbi:S9 family peptidase [Ferroacidibacillus organovorans]|uniref:Peptidase S9 prolyl oligopeptidase catalytic domain-containing protein n=1 Tax=Ferroacidibacillus organovorans TaxID=1765683 RepID=A0A162TWX8_9BACL|nr:S9 family peptidase [Ferroacidibacillus organovorans]KYP81201.1 hypothetical protein AYJ22_08180 [Ferroacidibacillus organovorans]OAG93900.1 hypothetical protein AYW79_08150 [Ferroacidibacillus organovorans]OPG17714.1 hypothetical protein B2M26_00785 [Ferroacidibacillus organovorans]